LPSNEEWEILYRYADGTSGTSSPYQSEKAGKFLKATNGWNNYEETSGNGTDAFGFSALPGGTGDSTGTFIGVGNHGCWWGSSEDCWRGWWGEGNCEEYIIAYYRSMMHYSEFAHYYGDYKSYLCSVRCIQGTATPPKGTAK